MNKENLIGEAVEAAAFITNEEGYDVAVLRRVIANEVADEQHTLLTDDEWQSLVNLVNAAPAMLKALQYIASLSTGQGVPMSQCAAVATAMEAIDKATK